jgi:hypothetical protein
MLKFILKKPILTKISFSPGIKYSPQYDLIRLQSNILPLKIRETQRGKESLAFLIYFDIRHNNDGGVAPSNRLQHFLLRIRIEPKSIWSLEIFQNVHRKPNPRTPVLWHCVSTKCNTNKH